MHLIGQPNATLLCEEHFNKSRASRDHVMDSDAPSCDDMLLQFKIHRIARTGTYSFLKIPQREIQDTQEHLSDKQKKKHCLFEEKREEKSGIDIYLNKREIDYQVIKWLFGKKISRYSKRLST